MAISKECQRKKIGTNVLRIIIKNAVDLAANCPIRVITIDARDDLRKWYVDEGFIPMKYNRPGQDGITTTMYFDCIRYPEELEGYVNEMHEMYG